MCKFGFENSYFKKIWFSKHVEQEPPVDANFKSAVQKSDSLTTELWKIQPY